MIYKYMVDAGKGLGMSTPYDIWFFDKDDGVLMEVIPSLFDERLTKTVRHEEFRHPSKFNVTEGP